MILRSAPSLTPALWALAATCWAGAPHTAPWSRTRNLWPASMWPAASGCPWQAPEALLPGHDPATGTTSVPYNLCKELFTVHSLCIRLISRAHVALPQRALQLNLRWSDIQACSAVCLLAGWSRMGSRSCCLAALGWGPQPAATMTSSPSISPREAARSGGSSPAWPAALQAMALKVCTSTGVCSEAMPTGCRGG